MWTWEVSADLFRHAVGDQRIPLSDSKPPGLVKHDPIVLCPVFIQKASPHILHLSQQGTFLKTVPRRQRRIPEPLCFSFNLGRTSDPFLGHRVYLPSLQHPEAD